MAKPNVTLKFVSLNLRESLYVQVKISSLPKILLCVIICSFVITLCRLHAFLFWLKERINQFTIKSQQSLLMNRDGPQLKKTSESITLMLFSQG